MGISITTDALACTNNSDRFFAALCTSLEREGILILKSNELITCEVTGKGVTYYLAEVSEVALGVPSRPVRITVNGKQTSDFQYDAERNAIIVVLPAGEGTVAF